MKYDAFICEIVACGRISPDDARGMGVTEEVIDLIETSRLSGERVVNLSVRADGTSVSWAVAPFATGRAAWTVRVPTRGYRVSLAPIGPVSLPA